MRFYLARGSIWTPNQAEAKAAQGDASYETIEVPTDKPGLGAFLNTFFERFGGALPVVAQDDAEPVVRAASPRHPSPDCPACQRDKRIARMVVNSTASVSILADIEDVTDPKSIDKIIRAAKARKAVIEADG